MAEDGLNFLGKRRLDLATAGGLLVSALGVFGGMLAEGGHAGELVQLTAALIVLGGTLGAVMVTTPSAVFASVLQTIPSILWHRPTETAKLKAALLSFSNQTRKIGIASLEQQIKSLAEPFFKKALGLGVDGADAKTIRSIMELELTAAEERGEAVARVFDQAGGYAPTIGIIGAVLGLIQVMKHLGDIEAVGHGIAVAFVATVYGVSFANLLLLPVANKLRSRLAEELRWKEMIVEGVASMTEGLHPWLIESRLEAFCEEPKRGRAGKKGRSTANTRISGDESNKNHVAAA